MVAAPRRARTSVGHSRLKVLEAQAARTSRLMNCVHSAARCTSMVSPATNAMGETGRHLPTYEALLSQVSHENMKFSFPESRRHSLPHKLGTSGDFQ